MTEPTPGQPTEPKRRSRLRALFLRRPGETADAAERVLTIGAAMALAAAVTVGVIGLTSHRGEPDQAAAVATSRGPMAVPDGQGTPMPSPSASPSRRPGGAPPTRPRQRAPGTSKKHHLAAGSASHAPHGAAGPTRAIVSYQSGRCIDGGSGSPLQIWDCDGSAGQRWVFASDGTVRVLGECMTLSGGSSANGTPIVLSSCDGGPSQRFVLKSSYDLVNLAVDKCVDVKDQQTASGTHLQIWSCAGTSNQKWHT